MNLTLDSFDKNDKLKNYVFESETIKAIDFESEEPIFEYTDKLRIFRRAKKDKLIFVVEGSFAEEEFKEEDKAIEHFKNWADELKFLSDKTKENIISDGRRYFWKINEQNEVIGRL